ncbi:MAG: hypothetical protein WCK94_12340 [Comamonadaceae bacterium]
MMSSSPHIPPRFLPTLTEIVPSPPIERAPAQALDPLIEQQVRELVRTLVAEQFESLRAAMREAKGEPDTK